MRLRLAAIVMLIAIPFLLMETNLREEPAPKPITVATIVIPLPKTPPKTQPKAKPKAAEPQSWFSKAPPIEYTEEDLECLTTNVYFESKGQPHVGQRAVARVTYNRALLMPSKSLCEAVYFKKNGVCAFSWVCEGKKNPPADTAWQKAREAALHVLENVQSCCKGFESALYFHADYVYPQWANERKFLQQIGNHLFYR